MHMRFDKWAVTAQEALQSSLSIAADAEAGEVKPIHLLKALLSSDERNLRAIIERVGADPAQVEAQVDDTIARQPKVTGDMTKMSISSELARVGGEACQYDGRQLCDQRAPALCTGRRAR